MAARIEPLTEPASEAERAYAALVEAGTARATRRAYAADLARFWAWARARAGVSEHYPVESGLVEQYCLAHLPPAASRPLAVATLRRYLASLAVAHHARGFESPTAAPRVRLLLRRAARACAGDRHPQRKAAATRDLLEKLVATCGADLHGVRDRALLLTGFAAGGRRRGELAAFRVNDLGSTNDGYRVTVRSSKTDPTSVGHAVPVTGPAADALHEWLVRAAIDQGYVFRGIRPDKSLTDGLSGRSIARAVQRRARLAGFDPAQFGGHSLRAGFVTEAARQGVALPEAMALSGHRSVDVAQGYYRASEADSNPASDLLS